MDKGTIRDFAEKSETSPISKIEMPEEGMLKTEILDPRNGSSDFSNIEIVSFPSSILEDGSSECLLDEFIVSNPVTMKTDSTAKLRSLESVAKLTESTNEFELLESIVFQTEETEEILDMILRAKEKLEFFIFRVEYLVKSLQEISKHSVANSRMGNSYLKNMYRKKLDEFASDLLNKVKKSLKDLEADYETLKEQEKKADETFKKITEFHRISDRCTAEIYNETVDQLKETVDHLKEEICLLKPKQLSEIEKVSYIETDIEMLYDLYRRF